MIYAVRIFIVGVFLSSIFISHAQDVVISEVLYNPASGNERVKLTNTTAGTINVTNWWFCAKISYRQLSSATVSVISGLLNMPGGSSVVLEFSTPYLDNTASDLGLYTNSSFSSCGSMVDFVQWGGSFDFPAGRENVAVEACLWEDEQFAATASAGDALMFDGSNTGGSCSNCGNNGATVLTTLADLSNAPTTLPVELVRFKVRQMRRSNLIVWTTAQETGVKEFQIQRSNDGMHFSAIGTRMPAGNAHQVRDYQFEDSDVQYPRLYYRLRTVDNDGSWAFSPIGLVQRTTEGTITLGQVGSDRTGVHLQVTSSLPQTALQVELIAPNGRTEHSTTFDITAGAHLLHIKPEHPIGWHVLVVRQAGRIIGSAPVVLLH